MPRAIRTMLFVMALVWGQAVAAWAFDASALLAASRTYDTLNADLERIQGVIATEGATDEQLAAQRGLLDKLIEQATVASAGLKSPLDDVQQQLLRLGPAPTDGTAELPTIANERKSLSGQFSQLTAIQKQFELLQLESEQTISRLLAVQREQFLQRIFKADRSILNPLLWRESAGGLSLFSTRITAQLAIWWREAFLNANWSGLALFPLGFAVILAIRSYAIPWLAARLRGNVPLPVPGGQEGPLLRLWRVIWGIVKFWLLVPFLGLLLVAALSAANILTPSVGKLLEALIGAATSSAFYIWVAYLVASPRRPERRLIAVDDRSARVLVMAVALASIIYAFGSQFAALADALYVPVSFAIGQSAISTSLMTALLAFALLILRRQAAKGLAGEGTSYFLIWFLKAVPLLWVALAVALGALFLGYIALAYFTVGNLLDTAMLAVVLGVIHAFGHALASEAKLPESPVGIRLRELTKWGEAAIERLVLVFRTVIDVTLVAIAIPALSALWTVSLVNVDTVLGSFAGGIRIGSIVISPSALVIAAAILALGIFLTRVVTRWLQQRVLSQTNLDKGVQDSVRTGASYAGYTLASAFALSVAGLDFSNLAIVAGALGVGIGFGLQSIVNNFVSGLILLAERPVRVGDWVVTAAGEGLVKKINVRSTEIETFDNCTIIMPNSNLITESVRNWTHRDTMGRFLVTISANYGSDADAIVKTLADLAAAHPKVLRHPPPMAQLSRLAPLAMEFELRGHVMNVFDAGIVSGDLRLAIVKALGKNILAIVPPQEPAKKK